MLCIYIYIYIYIYILSWRGLSLIYSVYFFINNHINLYAAWKFDVVLAEVCEGVYELPYI